MIKNYYNFLRLLLLFVALSQVDTLLAQGTQVTGKISEATSPDGIPGVLVSVKGKQQTTVSDLNGNFSITITDANAVLEFKSVGYTTREIAVQGKSTINVTLEADLKSLDEVVVVGYGTQKKVNLVGAVSTVKVDERLLTRSVPNVSSALSGLAPGLAVIQTSGMAGNNGAALVIRGLGTTNGSGGPLIVVDGMPGVDINRININDVETISVLKDASSASVYGSRAANGVILITTKTGKGAKKTSINFNGNTSIERPTEFVSTLSNYPRSLTLQQHNDLNSRLPATVQYQNGTIDEWMAKGMIDPLRYPNTDWWDVIMRDGVLSNYNLSATGGTDKSNFFASVGLKDEKGLQINNDYNQYNTRFNFDYAIKSNVSTGIRFNGNWSNYVRAFEDGFTEATAGNGRDLRYAIAGITPYDPATGYYGGAMAYAETIQAFNPYVQYTNRLTSSERQEAFGQMYLDWTPVKGLTARVDYGLTYINQFQLRADIPTRSWDFQRNQPGGRIFVPENDPVINNTNDNYRTLLTGRLNYKATIAKNHDISAMFAYQEEFWKNRSLDGERYDRTHPSLTEINGALTTLQAVSGASDTEGIRSYIGSFNYSAFSKYIFDASFRIDGSSKFDLNNRWGFFPAVGFAWRFTQEDFLKPILGKFLSSGKIRANIGKLGDNNGIGKFEQQVTLNSRPYVIGGQIVRGFRNEKLINANLSWESTTASNIGLELGFLNDKLFAEFEYYNRLNTGIIRPTDLSILLDGNYSAPRANLGKMRNQGLETTITWVDKISEVNYRFNLNASYNINKLEQWNEPINPSGSNTGNYSFVGMPYNFLYSYEDNGIAQTYADIYAATPQGNVAPGDVLRKDLNGDGRITAYDRRAYSNIQNTAPSVFFGLNSQFSWKNLDLAVLLQGSAGRKDFLRNGFWGSNYPRERASYSEYVLDRPWSLENRDGEWPRFGGSNNNNLGTTFWLQDMDFIRIKNIQLGYNLPKKLVSRITASNLRIAASAENLFTFTGYEGPDPEKSASSDEIYPLNRSFSVSLQLGF